MNTDLSTRPQATTYSVEELLRLAQQGRLRVPSFQRTFKWSAGDVRALFDSIIRGFPVGTLLLWRKRADTAVVRFADVEIAAPAVERALWLVDGQQRVHSLVAVLLGTGAQDDSFALHWDLEERRLERKAMNRIAPDHWLPLQRILDVADLWEWVRTADQERHVREAERLAKTIREYSVPAYEVENDDEGVLRTIFDRMNNAGRPLSRAEVFNALHASSDAEQPSSLQQLVERVRLDTFGPITDDRVLQTVLALRGGDVYRDLHDEFKPGEDPGDAYTSAERALAAAFRFLSEEVGIPRVELLPASFVIVPLARFLHLHPDPLPRTRLLLRRWVWRAASLEGVTGRTEALRQGVGAVDDDESRSVARLLELIGSFPRNEDLALPKSYAFNQARAKLSVLAMADRAPVDLRTREQVIVSRVVADHGADALRTVYAPAVIAEHDLGGSLANRVLHPPTPGARLHDLLLAAPPSDLNGHVIDERAAAALRSDDVVGFIRHRETLLQQALQDFVAARAEWDRSDRPPLSSALVA